MWPWVLASAGAHALLLAGILILLPDGRPDAGVSATGVEVQLMPAEQAPGVRHTSVADRQTAAAATVEIIPEKRIESVEPDNHPDGQKQEMIQKNSQIDLLAEVSIEKTDQAAEALDSAPGRAGGGMKTAAPGDAEVARDHAVRQRLESFKHYPASARRRGIEGSVDVSFRLNAEGHAVNMQLLTGSGYAILDDAALTTVRRAEPFPVHGGSYRFRLLFTRS